MTAYVVHKLWAWLPMAGITFGKHIFVKDPNDKITVEHEVVHVRQQEDFGWWFWFSYLFLFPIGLNYHRARWEGEAYAVQAKAGCKVEELAKMMSGAGYLWPCRQKFAEECIRKWL